MDKLELIKELTKISMGFKQSYRDYETIICGIKAFQSKLDSTKANLNYLREKEMSLYETALNNGFTDDDLNEILTNIKTDYKDE